MHFKAWQCSTIENSMLLQTHALEVHWVIFTPMSNTDRLQERLQP
jgi:hypothetical protein